MKIIYQAEDGRQFDTEAECLVYERDIPLRKFIESRLGSVPFELDEVVTFFKKHFDELSAIVKPVEVKSDDSDGWISNIGYARTYYPDSLSYDTKIEVKFRNGGTGSGIASDLGYCWIDGDGCWDIVAYRIL